MAAQAQASFSCMPVCVVSCFSPGRAWASRPSCWVRVQGVAEARLWECLHLLQAGALLVLERGAGRDEGASPPASGLPIW